MHDRASAERHRESAITRLSPTTTPAAVDPLSAVLQAVRLKGAVYFLVDARTPWVAEAPHAREIAAAALPGAQHVLEFHALVRGECYGGLPDQPLVKLSAGDVIAFPHGDAHVMTSTPGMREPPDLRAFREPRAEPLPFSVRMGPVSEASGAQAQLVCGFLGCDAAPFNPLLDALPRVLHVRAGAEGAGLKSLLDLAVMESQARRAGSECVLARLSELLFVETVRRHVAEIDPEGPEGPEGPERTGWLGGLRDPIVARALSHLHGRPAHDWSLDELASACASSRTVLAERFTHFVGAPPIQYLARWRMQLASSLLLEGATIAQVAHKVGYGSEAAFSRAFKKLVGVPPAAWREERAGSSAASA